MEDTNMMDKMMDRFRVKVIKVIDDDRTSICGEPFISPRSDKHDGESIDGNKRPYCIIPAHQGDYIKRIFLGYKVSDPFIPGVDKDLSFTPVPEDEAEEDGKK